ncbi:MAG: hypothetical protein AVDCRST_MAG95-982 [uncultured Adhaeribacter sp.]|uniref:Uncharacterized protein n=1 Tax=uncultured Adhaeribacter sp. TaxID=448109 RepID=A0A6J4HRM2_9BACT|nr:MAG: hypothetical protein AVDCRST_MAG95-982 [uncultured Adhaeribacter sp.]
MKGPAYNIVPFAQIMLVCVTLTAPQILSIPVSICWLVLS